MFGSFSCLVVLLFVLFIMAHTVSGLWVEREEKGAGFKANQGSHYCSQAHSAGKFMLSDREPGRLDLGVRTPLRMVPAPLLRITIQNSAWSKATMIKALGGI